MLKPKRFCFRQSFYPRGHPPAENLETLDGVCEVAVVAVEISRICSLSYSECLYSRAYNDLAEQYTENELKLNLMYSGSAY